MCSEDVVGVCEELVLCLSLLYVFVFFVFNDTATTEIYTFPYTTLFRSGGKRGLQKDRCQQKARQAGPKGRAWQRRAYPDRKGTRLNSSH